jgi:hypothetical protein
MATHVTVKQYRELFSGWRKSSGITLLQGVPSLAVLRYPGLFASGTALVLSRSLAP